MTTRLVARATAFSLSLIVTLAMLGGVNQLATSEPSPAALLAAASAARV